MILIYHIQIFLEIHIAFNYIDFKNINFNYQEFNTEFMVFKIKCNKPSIFNFKLNQIKKKFKLILQIFYIQKLRFIQNQMMIIIVTIKLKDNN